MTQAPTTPRTMSQAELFRLQLQADRQGFFRPEPKTPEEEDARPMTADELSAEYGLVPGVDYPWSLRR